MRKRFVASAFYLVLLILLISKPIFAITVHNVPKHEVKVASIDMMSVRLIEPPMTTEPAEESHQEEVVKAEEVVVEKTELRNDYGFTKDEMSLFERLVHAEAEGEPYEGKVAVANVILNRINSSKFPNTLKGVIYQKNQFSPIYDGRINNTPSEESKAAVRAALNGKTVVPSTVGFFYEPTSADTHWVAENKIFYKVMGNHYFYYE